MAEDNKNLKNIINNTFFVFSILALAFIVFAVVYDEYKGEISYTEKANLIELHEENSDAFIHAYNEVVLKNTNQTKPEEIKIDIKHINRGNHSKFLAKYHFFKTQLYFDKLYKEEN